MRSRRPFSWANIWPMASRFLRDRRAATAVEFAVIVPFALVLLAGEYTLTSAMSTKRKLTITAHAMADLVARQTTMNSSLMTNILNAAQQMIAPYDMSDTTVVVAELTTDASGSTTVTWSQATTNGTPLTLGSTFTFPPKAKNMAVPSTSLIYASTSYNFKPAVQNSLFGQSTVFNSTFYENPRVTSSIPYTN